MSDQEFDSLLRDLARTGKDPAPEGFDARLEETLEELPMKKNYVRIARSACVAAALCGTLTVSALAVSPAARDMLNKALGSFAPYTQTVQGEAVDQDIRVRVVSAMADSVKATVYAEITDLSGKGRLACAKQCGSFWLDVPEHDTGKGLSLGMSGGHKVAYDEKTQTLLYAYEAQYGELPAEKSTGKLTMTKLVMESQKVSVEAPDEKLLTGSCLKTQKLEGGETVLLPGQTKNDWKTDVGVTLSSLGYAKDGRIHFLFAFPEGIDPANSSALVLIRSKTDMDRELTYNDELREVPFTRDGRNYLDYSVEGKPEDREDVEFSSVDLYLDCGTPDIEGKWEISVNIPRVKETVSSLEGAMASLTETVSPLSGKADNVVPLRELRMSPLGVIIEADPQESQWPEEWNVGAYMEMAMSTALAYFADGSKVKLKEVPAMISPNCPVQYRWEFPEAVDDLNTIVGLSVGKWYLGVKNGVAGESCMLDEQPQVSVDARAVDQDIRVRIVSVKADSVKATVCAEFTDLSGKGRLSKANCSGVLNIDTDSAVEAGGVTSGERVSYDEKTQTMRCVYEAQTGLRTGEATTGTLEIKKIVMSKDSGLSDIKGDWSIPLNIDGVCETAGALRGELCGVSLDNLRISTLGVNIETSCPESGFGISPCRLWVYYADGSKEELTRQPAVFIPGHPAQNRWEFAEELDSMSGIDKIVGVSVDKWYIPVEHGIPSAGHWLDEVPHA